MPLRLAVQTAALACSRAFFSEGKRMLMSRAMMEITTSSSISVNAPAYLPVVRRSRRRLFVWYALGKTPEMKGKGDK